MQKDFIVQAGDPTDTGEGGSSVWYHIEQEQQRQGGRTASSIAKGKQPAFRLFKPERHPNMKHAALGTLSMAVSGDSDTGGCGSIFFVTLTENATYLDGKHAPFGRCVEDDSFETLRKFNTEVLTDDAGKPLRDVRIRHIVVLDDPFDDPDGLMVPPNSPAPTAAQLKSLRVAEDEDLPDENADQAEIDRIRREREARAQALTLEMVGDLPFADVAPPENVLFVCKLNAVTRSEDLELIFSRFGTIMSCEVIRDKRTGDSLNYAFIEFDKKDEAERAYMKMDNVLIDDRRIHVDFSQSVSKLHNDWVYQRTGGKPPPNRSNGRHDGSFGDRSPPSERSRSNGKGNGEMLFDLDEYDRSERKRSDKSGYRGDRRQEPHRNGDSRNNGRRQRSRSRERSPHRRDNRHNDDRRNGQSNGDRERYR